MTVVWRLTRPPCPLNLLSDCIIWTGQISPGGYGRLSDGKRYAHRAAYEAVHGPIPAGLQIDHLCRVRNCVNPEHLEAVTQRTNALRSVNGVGAVNARRTHCANGHPFDLDNTYIRPDNGGRTCKTCHRARTRAAAAARRIEPTPKLCAECGGTFLALTPGADAVRRFCSVRCKNATNNRIRGAKRAADRARAA